MSKKRRYRTAKNRLRSQELRIDSSGGIVEGRDVLERIVRTGKAENVHVMIGNPPDRRPNAPRLADKLLRQARMPGAIETNQRIRTAQKFYVAENLLISYATQHRDEAPEIVNTLRLPYRNVWLEIDLTIGGREAFLIQSDESFQRGEIWAFLHIPQEVDEARIFPYITFFEIGTDDGITFGVGDEVSGLTPDQLRTRAQLIQYWHEIIPPRLSNVLFGFLCVLNSPKAIIEREDLSDYNARQRRLYRHNKQRQEYYLVRVTASDEQIIYTRGEASDQPGTAKGEHDVRGHTRHYRSGRVSYVRPHKRGHGPLKSQRAGYEIAPPAIMNNFH